MLSWYQIAIILGGFIILAIAGIIQSRREQKALIQEIKAKQKLVHKLQGLGTGTFTAFNMRFDGVRPGDGLHRDGGYSIITKVSPSTLTYADATWWRRAYWAVRRFLSWLWHKLWRRKANA